MKTTAWAFLGVTLLAQTAIAGDATELVGSTEWQQRRLFEPSSSELERESAGRVFIYDGLMEKDLDRAMDEEFGRIESMMFIRTKKQTPRGDVVAYDDDC